MTLRVSVRVDADTAPLQDGLTRGSAALRGFGGEAARAGAATSQWAAEAQRSARMATAAQESHRAMAQAFAVTARAAAALGIALSTDQLIRYADTWKEVEGRLRLVTSGTAELMAVQERLFKVAQETRQGYEATADTYSRFARATQGLGVSQAQLLSVTETIGKAVTISGGSAASAEAALFQLGQAMAAGALRGEELNSVLEQAPRLAQAIAAGMGATVGQLRMLAEAGKLTADAVLKALLSQGQVVSNEFAQLEPTVAQAFVVLQNAVVKYVGEADRASGATRTLSAGLMGLAGNMDSAMAGAGALGVALAGALAGRSFGPVIQGMVQTAAATAQATSAAAHLRTQTLAGAQASAEAASRRVAEVAAAQSQVTVLRESVVRQRDAATAQMELTRGMVEATGRTQPYTKALEARNEQTRTLITYGRLERQLTAEATAAAGAKAAADAAVVRAQGDIAAATARTGLAARAAAAASSLLSGALALVGGPVGAAILATAAAVAYLATRTSDAERVQAAYNTTMAEGRRRTEELGSASRGRANQLMEEQRNAVSAAHAEAAALRAKVAALRDEAAALRELSASNGGMPGVGEGANQQIAALQAKLAEAEARIRAAAAALDAMQSVSQTTGDAIGLELASKVGRGSSAVGTFASRLADALKAAGQAAAGSRILADEQAELEKYTQTLTTVINAGVGAFSKYGLSATEAANTLEVLRLKLDPVRRAIADLNAETNLLHIPEGFERDWAALVTKMSKGGERLLTPEEILDSRKDLADNAAAKLDDAAAKAQREALAQRLLAGALTDAAKAHANNRIALADMAAKYPGLGVETAKTLLTTRDFAGELSKLPPNFQKLWGSMKDSANSQLAASMASLTQGMTAETRAAELMALAAGKGEAAQRRARIEAQVYAAALQGHADATRAAAEAQEAWTVIQIRAEQTAAIEEQIRAQELLTAAYAKGPAAVRAAEVAEKARTLALKEAEEGTDAYAAAYAHYLGLLQRGAEAERALAAAQAEQTARRDLSDAQAELALMREAEPIRARALESIRIQRAAVEQFGDATGAAAQRWIALQEQIADTRAVIKFWEDVRQVSEQIAGDIAENLYDSLMDRDRATSVADFFRSIFKRLAVEALKTQIVMPVVMSVVGSMPGLFGITSGGATATGQTAGAGSAVTSSLTNAATSTALSKAGSWAADKVVPGGLMGSIDAWAYSNLGIGSATYGAPVVASNGMLTGGGATSLATPTGITGGLSAYLGAAGAGAFGGGLLGGWAGTAANSKAVGAGVGAVAGAGSAYLASVLGMSSIGGPIGLAIGAIVGGIMGALGTSKTPAGPGAAIDYVYGADGQRSYQTYTRAGETADRVNAIGETLASTLDLLRQAGGALNGPISWHYGYNERDGVGTDVNGRYFSAEGDPDKWAQAVLRRLQDEGSLSFGTDAALVKKAFDSGLATPGNSLEDVVKGVALAKSIATATAGLDGVDKSLEALAASAKTTAAAQYDAAKTELAVAEKSGIAAEYRALLERQLRAAFDPAQAATQTVSQTGAAIAALNGEMQALADAVAALGLSISSAELEAWRAAKVTAMQQQYDDGLTAQLNAARGRDYLNQADTVAAALLTVRQEVNDLYSSADRSSRWATAVETNRLSAQKVIDDNALTGTGYQEFLQTFASSLKEAGLAADDIVRLTEGLHESSAAVEADTQRREDLHRRELAARVALGEATQQQLTAYDREVARRRGLAAVSGDLARAAEGALLDLEDRAAAATALTERWQSATASRSGGGVAGLNTSLAAASAQYTADATIDGAKAMDILRASVSALVDGLSDGDASLAQSLRWSSAVSGTARQALADALAARQAAAQETAWTTRQAEATEVLASRVTTARSAYLDALTREQATLRDTATRLREVGASLSALRASLALDSTLSPLSAQARLAEAKRQLQVAVDEFRTTGAADAGAKAQQLMDSYLRASRDYNSSAPAYQADYDWVVGLTSELEGLATTTADAKDAQARALDATVAALGGTTSAVLSLTDALARYTDAVRLSGSGAGAQDFGGTDVANDNRVVAAATVQSGNGYTGAFRDGAFARWAETAYAAHANDQGVSASVNAMLRASTGYTGDFRDGAFVDYVRSSAVTELQREAARSILRRNAVVPQFEAGGHHSGGARIVGERGIELEVTGAARYYSHEQTRDLLSPRPAPDLTPLVSAVTANAITISHAVTASGEAVTLAIGQLAAQVAGMRGDITDLRRTLEVQSRIIQRLAS